MFLNINISAEESTMRARLAGMSGRLNASILPVSFPGILILADGVVIFHIMPTVAIIIAKAGNHLAVRKTEIGGSEKRFSVGRK